MGLLDLSTNEILLDAVLTDLGRDFLSRNNGSFSIQKFALADDEIDYKIIKKFGITVGKDKIEKNTPVFEAVTNQNQALKYKLVSISNNQLNKLPIVQLVGDTNFNSSNETVNFLLDKRKKTSTITFEQTIEDELTIDNELIDDIFIVECNNLFLQIFSGNIRTPESVDNRNKARYIFEKTGTNSSNGSKLDISISAKNISPTLFQKFGNFNNRNIITTYVNITGMQSGLVKQVKVVIQNSSV